MGDEWGDSYTHSPGHWGKPYSPSAASISLFLASNDPMNTLTGLNFTGRATPDMLNTMRRSRTRSIGNPNSPSQFSFSNFLAIGSPGFIAASPLNSFRPLSAIGSLSRSPRELGGFRPSSAASHGRSRTPIAVPNFRTSPISVHGSINALMEQKTQTSARGPRFKPSQWESHKAKIKELFMDADMSLEETMGVMEQEFSFNPTKKQYNNKLKQWGFIKNISGATANWMVNKAKTRKREGKETEFSVGNQPWTMSRIERSARRARIEGNEALIQDPTTPPDVHYGTPGGLEPPVAATPFKANSSETRKWDPFSPPQAVSPTYLRLQWNGKGKEDLEKDLKNAQRLVSIGQIQEAEDNYLQALGGLQSLLSPTHKETNAVAYELAEFYAQHDRMKDADKVLDWMGDKHSERWGLDHKNVRAHLVKVADMLQNWSREDDAISMISRAADCYEQSVKSSRNNFMTARPFQTHRSHTGSEHLQLPPLNIGNFTLPESDADNEIQMDYRVRVAITRANAEDESAEEILLLLCEQCERHPAKLAMQIIEARGGLIEFYKNLELFEKFNSALSRIPESFWKIFNSDAKRTEVLFNAVIELITWLVKAGRYKEAEPLFEKTRSDAIDNFGEDNEVIISLLIRIGIIFQDHGHWLDARPKFEQALAASMTNFGLQSEMTLRLEEALYQKKYDASSPTSKDIHRHGHTNRWHTKALKHAFGCGGAEC